MIGDGLARVRAIIVQAYGRNLDGGERGPLVSAYYLARIRDVVRELAPAAEPSERCAHEGIGLPGCTTCDPRTFRSRADIDTEIATIVRVAFGAGDVTVRSGGVNMTARVEDLCREPSEDGPFGMLVAQACGGTCAEAVDLRARLVNIYHLTLTGGDPDVTLRAVRAASSPGAPAPAREYSGAPPAGGSHA